MSGSRKNGKQSAKYTRKGSGTFGLRLTPDERRELDRRAGEMAVGTYIRSILFADGVKRKSRGARAPVKNHAALAQVLACLGSSRLSETLERLADAADAGVLQFDPHAPAAIHKACEDIIVMRLLLMQSLGFQIDLDSVNESVSQTFTRAARYDPDCVIIDDTVKGQS